MTLTAKNVAALRLETAVMECLMDERRWTCRYCGHAGTMVMSEFCDRCGLEDCNQGEDGPVPRLTPLAIRTAVAAAAKKEG